MHTHTHTRAFVKYVSLMLSHTRRMYKQHHNCHLNVKTNDGTDTTGKNENDYSSHNELCIKNRVRPKTKKREREKIATVR